MSSLQNHFFKANVFEVLFPVSFVKRGRKKKERTGSRKKKKTRFSFLERGRSAAPGPELPPQPSRRRREPEGVSGGVAGQRKSADPELDLPPARNEPSAAEWQAGRMFRARPLTPGSRGGAGTAGETSAAFLEGWEQNTHTHAVSPQKQTWCGMASEAAQRCAGVFCACGRLEGRVPATASPMPPTRPSRVHVCCTAGWCPPDT